MKAVRVFLRVQPLRLILPNSAHSVEVLQVVMNTYGLYSKYFALLFDPSDMARWLLLMGSCLVRPILLLSTFPLFLYLVF